MNKIEEALVSYVSVLAEGSAGTHHAANRPRYERHLAQAALMFLALCGKKTREDLKSIVKQERHSFGWDMMEGDDGKATEAAFDAFAKQVEGA